MLNRLMRSIAGLVRPTAPRLPDYRPRPAEQDLSRDDISAVAGGLKAPPLAGIR